MAEETTPRVVIVTGAAGGIGRALLAEFSARGDRLIAVDVPGSDLADALASLGARHHALECDQSDEAQILALYREIDALTDRVDVLVNNAAIGPTMAATTATPLSEFRHSIRTNTVGPFVMAREAARRMHEGGVVVNTASLAGVLGNPCRNAYAASKAALISLTKSLACEWAGRGIRVVATAPGYVRTPMVAALEQEGKADMAAVRRRIPMGRLGRPDEIAAVAGFLASGDARYITGSVVAADGGWMSFNQPGHAFPHVEGTPEEELGPGCFSDAPRVVVVTGAANGLGRAIAARFVAGGDHVVYADKDASGIAKLTSELGGDHTALELDVTSEASVAAAFAAIAERYGHIDILVNNAAIADVFQPATEQDTADLERVLDVNLTGAFDCTKAAVGLMKGRRGRIINLGSINTFLPFAPRHAYGASKASIDILTRCMAAELGPQGIQTATIAPGYCRTPGVAALEREGRIGTDAIRRRIPMGDMGRPEDIAGAAWFLGSPGASYINGSILYVDGGWTSFGNAGDASEQA
ncbi:short chain dehydrogenase [Pseudooceanicola batsensis HTCC2597]|uniref:Short chain dehydrogenase n=1 Tax=Pseudooceanicola batsensis (strain ATCC BAA-863 / DSM 15984 / KCTC 12145 / HTCC2597) TaxID=252305 RepID=A3U149_PSEBH|nr:SDR family oxidoreductase [Pseudooceanicola batsensis]EAQ02032.1 short chain dehydrogenase [Pseudooceanicola batsensis HTCC2597]